MSSESMFVLIFICCKKSKERVETLEVFFSPPWCHDEETGGGVMVVPMEYEVPIIVLED